MRAETATDEPRYIVTRHRGTQLEYARWDFGQTWEPYRETATEYPDVVAREVARVWGSYGDGWTYSVEDVTTVSASDEPRADMSPPHDFAKPCSNCGWTHELTDDPERCEVCQASPVAGTDYCIAHTPPSPVLRLVIAAVLAEVARLQAEGQRWVVTEHTAIENRVHQAAFAIIETMRLKAGGAT